MRHNLGRTFGSMIRIISFRYCSIFAAGNIIDLILGFANSSNRKGLIPQVICYLIEILRKFDRLFSLLPRFALGLSFRLLSIDISLSAFVGYFPQYFPLLDDRLLSLVRGLIVFIHLVTCHVLLWFLHFDRRVAPGRPIVERGICW